MNCWFWNISRKDAETFRTELEAGWLRQGWGYDPALDLRQLAEKRAQGKELTKKEQVAWDRCDHMLEDIEPEDLVVVKNVPDGDHFTLVEVTGSYEFSLEGLSDFGHRLPVEIVQVFHKRSQVVPAPLANALERDAYPIRVTNKHRDAVVALSSTEHPDNLAREPEAESEMVARWREELIPSLRDTLRDSLNSRLAERLVLGMLERDGLQVAYTAGAGEKGADVLSEMDMGYGLSTGIAVQVKMKWGTYNQTGGVEQLKHAIDVHDVDVGLLVTFADQLGPKLEEALEEAQKEYRIEAFWGKDLYTQLLETIMDPEFEIPG